MTRDEPDDELTSRLLAFIERTSDLVGVVDEQGGVRYLNEAARKRLGVGDASGITTADVFPPASFSRYYDDVRPALLRTGTWHGELAVLTGSGAAVPMLLTIVAHVGPGGEVNGMVTYGREIAARPDSTEFDHDVNEYPDGSATSLAGELAVAVSHGLIQPHVQSVVELHTGVVVGYQGLARWEHPQRGLLEAEQFVDSVGNTPVLPVVDLAVLRRTAAAAARTARSGARVRA
jgi:hypothetical protein